jgi:hypothetical protein
MENEIEILASFLDSFEPEVSGRSSSPISAEDAATIAKLAAGELSESDRARLTPLLASNEQAMQQLVAALRGDR